MQVSVNWAEGFTFTGSNGQREVQIGGIPPGGGEETGIRPLEMMLLGLGGCTAYDVVEMLEKGRAGLTRCDVSLKAKRADDIPQVFTEIEVHFELAGDALRESAVERAISLTKEKYCSASIMLERGGVVISHTWTIVDA